MNHGFVKNGVRSVCAALVLGLAACGGGGGGSAPATSTPTTPTTPTTPEVAHGDTSTATVRSAGGFDYPLRLYTPPGYATNTATSYPVVYGLDGDAWFGNMVTQLEQLGVKAIVVGIGRSDLRDFDYQTSGAPTYYNFLIQVLVPYMDTQFRTQKQSRTLVGHSFGGSFVALALFMDQLGGKVFTNYVSLDGAWDENSVDLKLFTQEPLLFATNHGQLPATVVLAGATCCHYAIANSLYTQMKARNYQGLKLTLAQYPENHANMFLPAFTDAMRVLFVP